MISALVTADQWCAWARIELEEGRLDRAQAGFRQALALDPGSFAALFGLASALLDLGDVRAAAALVARMEAEAGDRPDMLWLAARIAAAQGRPARACEVLARLLAQTSLGPEQRAEALLALGIAHGELDEPGPAFAAAAAGKTIQRGCYASQAASREDEVAKLKRLNAWLAAQPADAWRAPPPAGIKDSAAEHVFLLGFPRSGTTLLEQVLATHPRVVTLEEAPTLATAYQAFLSDADACAALTALDADEATAWIDHYWQNVRKRGIDVSGKLFVDKQPAGTLYLPIIARLFPQARILFALRDPRDVVLSCFRQAFQINAMTYTFTDLAQTAACYDACMRFAAQARERWPLAWQDVRHESLVADFDEALRTVLAFIGLAPDPAMRDFAAAAATRAIRTPSATQVRGGLTRRGLGRWNDYRSELAPLLPILAPWIERFGYAAES